MIGYRLLPPAEEEMTEAAQSYDLAKAGLGDLFFDDIQHAIDTVREYPELGESVAYGFRRICSGLQRWRRRSLTRSSSGGVNC